MQALRWDFMRKYMMTMVQMEVMEHYWIQYLSQVLVLQHQLTIQ